jgi:site-specific recombinase
VAERSAETGSHYITRDRAEYRDMLRMPPAAARSSPAPPSSSSRSPAIGLSAFWSGLLGGVNYAPASSS